MDRRHDRTNSFIKIGHSFARSRVAAELIAQAYETLVPQLSPEAFPWDENRDQVTKIAVHEQVYFVA